MDGIRVQNEDCNEKEEDGYEWCWKEGMRRIAFFGSIGVAVIASLQISGTNAWSKLQGMYLIMIKLKKK